MNIILMEQAEVAVQFLPIDDVRAQHLLNVLKRKEGEPFDVGEIDGRKGKGHIEKVAVGGLHLSFSWGEEEPLLAPLDLVVGLSRPQTNRKILNEVASLGARSMRFVVTERGEPSYAESKLWTTGEWRRHVIAGVEQAFSTRLPGVRFGLSLEAALGELEGNRTRIALDNYEASAHCGEVPLSNGGVTVAIGSERGWTGPERDRLREAGFCLAHLGERVLRTETAVVSAVAITLSRLRQV